MSRPKAAPAANISGIRPRPAARAVRALLAASVVLVACTGTTASSAITARVEQLDLGSSTARVVTQLGRPTATNRANLLGLEVTTLVYREGITVCEVHFSFDRAFARECNSLPI